MRRIKLFAACSLDNFIARPDGGVEWLFHDADYGFKAFYQSVDTVFIGRKTYDMMVSFGEQGYRGKKNFVFSRTVQPSPNREVVFVDSPVRELVDSIRKERGRDLWLAGGGELNAAFQAEKLVDDVILAIHPVVLGSGIPLFIPGVPQLDLEFVRSVSYPSGLISLFYKRAGT